jgi:hypothetical protein
MKILDSKHGIYICAVAAGICIYLIDTLILGALSAIAPTFATWADEGLLILALGGLCILAYKEYGSSWQSGFIIIAGIVSFNAIPAMGVAMTIDTYPAIVTTAGLDESEKGKKTIFTARISPINSQDETEETHRAQDATILFPVYWWKRSSDTRVALKAAKNTQETVCITAYGIRSGTLSSFPNVVDVQPISSCK